MPKRKSAALPRAANSNDVLDNLTALLRHFTQEELIALVRDFAGELDAQQQQRLLTLVTNGPRPLAAEAMGLADPAELLAEIETLRDDIADDVYVEYGAGYDPEYDGYRGFGDDRWIDELDNLFAAATSLYRAGEFKAATEAYLALFGIFDLADDGFHFTRPKPAEALHTNLDEVKASLFIAIARSEPRSAERAFEVSEQLRYQGKNAYVLLDAWQGRAEWMAALEAALIERARERDAQDPQLHRLSHAAELLREFYRRSRDTSDYEALCRKIGAQQGWPYVDVLTRYTEQANWEKVLAWAEEGIAGLPTKSIYRPSLQEARGQALSSLGRQDEAFEALRELFRSQRTIEVYLKLRQSAQAIGQWKETYARLTVELQAQVERLNTRQGYTHADLMVAGLLAYAFLLEGDWQKAVEWALNPALPSGWREHDAARVVATGLLLMGTAERDETLTKEVNDAPPLMREHGVRLESVARSLHSNDLLDGAVRIYEQLLTRTAASKNPARYPEAVAYCKIIQSIRASCARAQRGARRMPRGTGHSAKT